MSISERLRAGIEMAGFNLTQASEITGIPYRSMQNYVRGEREPKAESLALIGERLGISLDWLLTGTGLALRVAAAEGPARYAVVTPREASVLEVYRDLDEDGQREVQTVAEEKRRLRNVELQLLELRASYSEHQRAP